MAENIPHRDEFYTGYLEEAPDGVASFVRRVVLGLFALTLGLAALLAASQGPFDPGTFEFGNPRTFEGVLELTPHPVLRVTPEEGGAPETHYLVAFGKKGAGEAVADLAGRQVRLEGTLIYREDQAMIELVDGTVEALEEGAPSPAEVPLGEYTLRGEIVDSKCYLGVMKPGHGKPHRACASLCIRGGIPPVFVVRGPDGPAAHLMLVGPDGEALGNELLEWVAEPLEVTGEVSRSGDLFTLRADPADFRRLL